ncbi:MAG: penicillin-binding protein 2 [Candidatus Omnitrophica bacterium]|nr:penicillin-binding protein 2 [Candidatus Omnitrophota bacterium]
MIVKRKLYFVVVVVMCTLFLLVLRLVALQIVNGDNFVRDAENLHSTTIKTQAARGRIFDRNGNPLALNVPSYEIFWRRTSNVINKEKLKYLFTLSGQDWSDIEKRIDGGANFIYFNRSADEDFLNLVKENLTRGIEWKENKNRIYPCGELAANIVGFVGSDHGLEGIERDYEYYLKGKSGFKLAQRDAKGNILYTLGGKVAVLEPGYDIYLTIDRVLQHTVERELAEIQQKFDPTSIVAIILEPKTGKILSLANYPSYDPNRFGEFPTSSFRNRAIADFYEPGSTFKIITASAALEEKIIDPKDRIFCENGSYQVAGHTIRDVHPYGWLTFREALLYSSNIAFTKIGQKMGEKELYKYLKKFGFGEKTGIDLEGEVNGLLRDVTKWSKLSIGAIPYGREIGVTPLQIASAVAAVANGGVLVKPFIVNEIANENGVIIKKNSPTVKRRVISNDSAKLLTSLLVDVVENGTGKAAIVNGYSIAGKTGTSQKYIPGEGYSMTKYVSSFIGYAPANDPQVLILVVVDEPKGAYYGGQVAAPSFKNIMEKTLRYLEIPPDKISSEMAGLQSIVKR